VPLTAEADDRFPSERQARCGRCAALLSQGIETVAYCEAKNDHSRQESRLSEREQIDEEGGELSRFARLRQVKYLNNIVEQDHRRIKRLVRPGLGFKSMSTARQIICGYEIFAMIRKVRSKGFQPMIWELSGP